MDKGHISKQELKGIMRDLMELDTAKYRGKHHNKGKHNDKGQEKEHPKTGQKRSENHACAPPTSTHERTFALWHSRAAHISRLPRKRAGSHHPTFKNGSADILSGVLFVLPNLATCVGHLCT